jgi:deoxyribodipyrimidine photo-lyase
MSMFEPTRSAALDALERFLPSAGQHYADHRNTDYGPARRDNISMLSPYLRHRLLSEEEVVRAVVAAHGVTKSEKFVQEVFWRSYWKGWLEQRPSIWPQYCAQTDELSDYKSADLDAALEARTGIDCFDHWMRELTETGYLHNHARMWFASIWIFTLRLPWQKGAALFLDHLFDGDPASNTLSWRWVAGLQTMGKHYVADEDNIRRYTEGRFTPTGLAVAPEPLVAWPHPAPEPISVLEPLPTGPSILLVTEEDMVPQFPDGVLAVIVCPLAQQSSLPVNAFRQAALRSSADAIAAKLGVPLVKPSNWKPDEWAEATAMFSGLPLVTAYPPVGPLQSALCGMEGDLHKLGHKLHYFRRQWDDLCWPHARKGFFPFKENIPAILRAVGIR